MLPSSAATISNYSLAPIQSNYSPAFPHSNQPGYLPQSLADQSLDPNSPDIFKQNMQLVQQHVARVNGLARSALNGIENAYRAGNTPSQTEADIAALKQNLQLLSDLMRQTGVGGLPLLPMPSHSTPPEPAPVIPTEEMMLTDTSRSVQVLYDRMKKSQESAAVVANLLSTPEHGVSRTGR
ncbi:hypothetical protein PILCRDRAFT_13720 [Piloderma croceum F 1598]|uniref:Uncharacterized protein n=1 Tax=Piloderma croceum (strain F 1598) TaxID=765440 RepID=A0A0C3BDE0_PILCF|nr:hypothetical protein PILCRDRAFT_13720 [Piloderma croceum F 1598]